MLCESCRSVSEDQLGLVHAFRSQEKINAGGADEWWWVAASNMVGGASGMWCVVVVVGMSTVVRWKDERTFGGEDEVSWGMKFLGKIIRPTNEWIGMSQHACLMIKRDSTSSGLSSSSSSAISLKSQSGCLGFGSLNSVKKLIQCYGNGFFNIVQKS
ncbi:hypothetical protein OSB04_013188 [Centaurea solstitialis]|uniref:Uncharacterized protein n=1 Tax=Centaurea solstitialis TaxID=347529 RepID=A0AA38WQG8_9ASTR|nr:hypothetical protein OSB04_013188 [Centaurea solstitialis]